MPTNRYRALIFDLDGTLLDNDASFRAAYIDLCRRYPDLFSTENSAQRADWIALYRACEERRNRLFAEFCTTYAWKTPPAFSPLWEEWIALYLQNAQCFSGVKELLTEWKEQGIPLGLLTNGETAFQMAKLTSSGLLPYFDCVLISQEIGISKPSPRVYQMASERLGVSVSDCLFIGDTPHTDILGAQNAGMDSVLLSDRESTVMPTYRAKTMQDLKIILEQ